MNASPPPIVELLEALTEGLTQPRHAWEAAAIAAALAIAWSLARLAARLAGPGEAARSARRLLLPLFGLAGLGVAEALLRAVHVVAGAGDVLLMRLAASLLATALVVRVLFALLRRVLRNAVWLVRLERAIAGFAVAVMALYATGWLGEVVDGLAAVRIPLGNAVQVSVWSLLVGTATVVVALLAAMWLSALIEERLAAEASLEPNLRTVLARAARAVLLLFAVLFALALSGIDLTVLSVFGGALGVGLGLGLQRIASNTVSGFILLLEHSLRIGDVVSVDKYYGQVTRISTRYTVLRSPDGTEAVIPNEMLVSTPVVNLTMSDRSVVLTVDVALAPDTDVALARSLLVEAAAGVGRVLAQPAPTAVLKEFAGGNLLFEVNFAIGDPENGRQNVQSDVAIAVLARLRASGMAPAAPRASVQWQAAASVANVS